METKNDETLWQLARQRAAFKKSLGSYFLVNSFLVAIWFFSSGNGSGYFWPVWPMLGWGFGLFMQYLGAYHGTNIFSVEKEYEALKRKNQP